MQQDKLVTEAIKEIFEVVNRENELKPLLMQLAEIVRKFLGRKSCTIWLHDKETDRLMLRGASGRHEIGVDDHFYAHGECLTWYVFEKQRPLRLDQASDMTDRWIGKYTSDIYPDREETGGPFLGVPVISKDACLGTLKFGIDNLDYRFTDDDLAFAQIIANEIAVAVNMIENKQEVESLKKVQNERLIFLSDFSAQLLGCSTLKEIHGLTTHTTTDRLRCRTSSIFLFAKDGRLKREYIAGLKKHIPPIEYYKRMQGLTGSTVGPSAVGYGESYKTDNVDEEPLIQNDPAVLQVAHDYEEAVQKEYGFHEKATHVITVPLNSSRRSIGVLRVINKLDEKTGRLSKNSFDQIEYDWLLTISSMVSVAISDLLKRAVLDKISKINELLFKKEKEVFATIAKLLTDESTLYHSCIIRALNESTGRLVVIGSSRNFLRVEHLTKSASGVAIGSGITGKTFLTQKPFIAKNLLKDAPEFAFPEFIGINKFVSMICLPLQEIDKTTTFGTLTVYTKFEYVFDPEEIKDLENFARQIANILQNFQEKKELAFVNRLSEKINQETRIRKIFRVASFEIPRITGFDGCVIVRKTSEFFEIIEGPARQTIGYRVSTTNPVARRFINHPSVTNHVNVAESADFAKIRALTENVHQLVVVPIITKDKSLYGALILFQFTKTNPGDSFDGAKTFALTPNENLYMTIANQIAAAIDKNVLLEQIRDEFEKKAIIDKILRKISSIETPEQSLKTILEKSIKISGADSGFIAWFSKDEKYIRPVHMIGLSQANLPKFKIGVTGVTGWVYQNKKGYLWPGGEVDHLFQPLVGLEKKIVSEIIAPMIYDEEVTGIIAVQSTVPNAFDQSDLDFLQTLANETAIITQNHQFYQAAVMLGQAKFDAANRSSICMTLAKTASEIMHTTISRVFLKSVEDGVETLKLEGWHGFEIDDARAYDMPKTGDGISWRTMQSREQNIVDNLRGESYHPQHPEFNQAYDLESMISMPLIAGGECLGVVNTYARRQYRFFDKERFLLKNLAASGAIALKNAELVELLNTQKNLIQRTTEEMIEVVSQSSFHLITRQINHEIKNSLLELAFDLHKIKEFVFAKGARKQVKVLNEQSRKIENNAKRIENLLHIFKYKERRIESINIKELIRDNIIFFQERDVEKPIFFQVNVEGELFVDGDKAELSVVIYNFLSNAVKSIRRAKRECGEVKIDARQKRQGVFIKISDNGTGIKREHKDKIFTPYFTTTQNGVGLGLYVVNEIVKERYHGEVSFESRYGEGTAFTLKLSRV